MRAEILALAFLFTTAAQAADITIVDGDTFDYDGERIRVISLDTPEAGGRADCLAERMLGTLATQRAAALLYSGKVEIDRRGRDQYGRTLAAVTIDGQDMAQTLIREGYGRPWRGRSEDWCK
jgi:endonuclease YncB( thermonuclease family)